MCIRDRNKTSNINQFFMEIIPETQGGMFLSATFSKRPNTCLLYTSDAADERSSVDLGGRRIIKKKKKTKRCGKHRN